MRSFVAAACCLIVGLEILIGVPVAVCLGFLCFGSDYAGTYVAESQPGGPIYSSATFAIPPLPAGPPLVIAAPGQPLPTFDPYTQAPPQPSLCPAPAPTETGVAPSAAPIVASLPASDLAADGPPPSQLTSSANEPKNEKTEDGEVKDDSLKATEAFLSQFAWNSVFLTVDDAQRLIGGGICTGNDLPLRQAAHAQDENRVCESSLHDSMLSTAQLLYRQADRHEVNQEYDLADRLRSLARDLRDEATSVQRYLRENGPPPSAEAADRQATAVEVGPPPRG